MKFFAKLALRFFAVVGSLVILVTLSLFFVLSNLDLVSPWLLDTLKSNYAIDVTYGQVETEWPGVIPAFRVHDLKVNQDDDSNRFEFTAERLEIRLVVPSFSFADWGIEYFGVINPRFKGHFKQKPRTEEARQPRFTVTGIDTNSLLALTKIQNLEIVDGQFEVLWESEQANVNAVGEIVVNSVKTDDGYSIAGSIDTKLHNLANIKFSFDVSAPQQEASRVDFAVDANSVDLAWLGAINLLNLELQDVKTVVNASLAVSWVDDELQSAIWSATARDPVLDGNIPNVTEAVLQIKGSWTPNGSDDKKLIMKAALESLDVRVLLNNFASVFPPRFYNHVSKRLQSLWITRVTATLAGDPARMILPSGERILEVDGKFKNFSLIYADKWPPIEGGEGVFEVRETELLVTGTGGSINGQPLASAVGTIDNFLVADPRLVIKGEMEAPLTMAFELFGPNGAVRPGRTKGLAGGSGAGQINLVVNIPLRRARQFDMTGVVTPVDLSVVPELGPEITEIKGQVEFNRIGVTTGSLSGKLPGGDMQTSFKGEGAKGDLTITGSASGSIDASAVVREFSQKFVPHASGNISWEADYKFANNENSIVVNSALDGIELDFPSPLNKIANDAWPLKVSVHTTDQTKRKIEFQMDPLVSGVLHATLHGNSWKVDRGSIGIPNRNPDDHDSQGVHVNMVLPELDYEAWSQVLRKEPRKEGGRIAENLQTINVRLGSLVLGGTRRFSDVELAVRKMQDHWFIDISSDEVIGSAEFRDQQFLPENEFSILTVDLKKCKIPPAEVDPSDLRDPSSQNTTKIEFSCEDTQYGELQLGRSTIVAEPFEKGWKITKANFDNNEFASVNIEANGEISPDSCRFAFTLTSENFGKAMASFGYQDIFNSGAATIKGNLQWDGSISRWSAGKSSGNLNVSIDDGNLTYEPGLGSRVVGLLNYDSLFKRLTLDFGDLFASGFTFDKIRGKVTLESGVFGLEEECCYISGTSADIFFYGSTNWTTRNHNLLMDIQPHFDKGIPTLATILISPVAGIVAYLALKSAGNENPKINYRIAGTWDEPDIQLIQ